MRPAMFVVVFPVITHSQHVQRHLATLVENGSYTWPAARAVSEDDKMADVNTITKIDIFSVLGQLFGQKIAESEITRYKFHIARQPRYNDVRLYLDFMAYSEREVVKVQYDETNEIRAPYSLSFILTNNN